jgi:hypothetical protein
MRFAKLQRVGPIPTRVSEGFTEDGTGSSKPKWAGSIPAEAATSSSSSWLRNLGSHPRKTGSNPRARRHAPAGGSGADATNVG